MHVTSSIRWMIYPQESTCRTCAFKWVQWWTNSHMHACSQSRALGHRSGSFSTTTTKYWSQAGVTCSRRSSSRIWISWNDTLLVCPVITEHCFKSPRTSAIYNLNCTLMVRAQLAATGQDDSLSDCQWRIDWRWPARNNKQNIPFFSKNFEDTVRCLKWRQSATSNDHSTAWWIFILFKVP